VKFTEINLRLYFRGEREQGFRYRLLCFDESESPKWEACGDSIAETVFNAGLELVRIFAVGLDKVK
jgi:hypothetical protein